MLRHFECKAGHDFDVDDTGDTASEIAVHQTRLRLQHGCDVHVGPRDDRTRCNSTVTEYT